MASKGGYTSDTSNRGGGKAGLPMKPIKNVQPDNGVPKKVAPGSGKK